MYMDILRRIDGIGIFPLVSLLLFVTVFAVVLIHVARADRSELERRAALPLEPALDAGPGATRPGDGRTR